MWADESLAVESPKAEKKQRSETGDTIGGLV
jgi:hypothetical protein